MMFDTLSARKKAFLGSAIQNRRPMMSDTKTARKWAFLGCPMQIPPEMAQICPPGSGKNPEFCIGHLLAHGGVLSRDTRQCTYAIINSFRFYRSTTVASTLTNLRHW